MAEATAIEMVRKITTDTLGTRDKNLCKTGPVDVMKVIGKASAVSEGVSVYGKFRILHGEFMAIGSNGKMAKSEKLILPEFMIEGVAAQLDKAAVEGVEFAFHISTRPTDPNSPRPNAWGYEYVCENLMKPSEAENSLTARARALGIIPAPGLPAPALAPAPKEK